MPITKRKKPVDWEGKEQVLFFRWLRLQYPGVFAFAFHVPNGGQRSAATGAVLKRQGVKKGVPDIFIPLPKKGCHGLVIEFKASKPHTASVTKEQQEWVDRLNSVGYRAVVCKGFDAAKAAVDEYMECA